MNTFNLAFRNILRNKRRTFLTLLAIIAGVTSIVVFGGFIEYTFQALRESTIRTQLGHLQIYQQGYKQHGVADPAHYLIREPEKVETAVASLPEILTVTRRLTLSGLISNGNKTLSAKVTGIIPAQEQEFSASETLLAGQQLDENTPDDGVIGLELAKALNAKIGDYLMVLTNTLDGAVNAVEFKLAGIAQTGSQDYDAVFVKLPLKMVQKALETEAVEKIIVLLKDGEDLNAFLVKLAPVLQQTGLQLEYSTWDEMAAFYHKVVAMYHGLFDVIRIIISVIVLFSIINTMTMSVFERTREIGTLRAIGTTRWGIMQLFITEGLLLGIVGSLLGLACGIVAAAAINISGGIDIPAPPGMSLGYIALILIVPSIMWYAFCLTVSVAVLSSILPAWKASRIKIVEALAYI
jgi:putative ABC transport system permease protein